MVVIGWLRRAVILGAKFDECSSCHVPGPHLLIRKMHWFTLFWMPVMLLWVSHGVLCPECGALEGVSMLGMRRALRSGRLPLGRHRPVFEAVVRDHLGGTDPSDWASFGLEPGSTESEIRARWRELAKTLHPDAGGDAARFVAMQATLHRLLASEGSVTVRPDPAELFDPVIVNPKKGLFDFYSTKLWPGTWLLLIALGMVQSAVTPEVVAGRGEPSGGVSVPVIQAAPVVPAVPAGVVGTAHRCWYTADGINGCEDDTTTTLLFGSRVGTSTTCWFVEPLDYGESASCR